MQSSSSPEPPEEAAERALRSSNVILGRFKEPVQSDFSAQWDERGFDGGGGTGDDGRMEARVARLEASLSHIERDIGEIKADIREGRRDARTDFRLLFGAIIAVALGITGLMARGFGWL